MFNCLPGAMLQKGHTHQWKKGFSCSRVPPQHNAWMTASHRLFNPGPPGGRAPAGLPGILCAVVRTLKIFGSPLDLEAHSLVNSTAINERGERTSLGFPNECKSQRLTPRSRQLRFPLRRQNPGATDRTLSLGEQHLDIGFNVVSVHQSLLICCCHPALPVDEKRV